MKYSAFTPPSGNFGVKGTALPNTRVISLDDLVGGTVDWSQIDGLGRPQDYATWTGVAQNLLRDDQFGAAWTYNNPGLFSTLPKQGGSGYTAGIEPYFLNMPQGAVFSFAVSELVVIQPSTRYYFSARVSRGTTASGSGHLYARWFDGTITHIVDNIGINWDDTSVVAGEPPKEFLFSMVAPNNAKYVQLLIARNTNGTLGHTYRVESPRVSNVGPSYSIGGISNHTVNIASDGTSVISGLPDEFRFTLYKDNVAQSYLTDGGTVTWSYVVINGQVNGRTAADAAFGLASVNSVGIFDINTLESTQAAVKLTALKYGTKVDHILNFTKNIAPGISGGTSGGTGGNLPQTVTSLTNLNISNTNFQDLTGTINGTLPTGKTTARVSVAVNIKLSGAILADEARTFELKVERFIGGVWTAIGATVSATAVNQTTSEGYVSRAPAIFNFTRDEGSLTAGSSYQWRVVGRVTTTAASGAGGCTGSVQVSAP